MNNRRDLNTGLLQNRCSGMDIGLKALALKARTDGFVQGRDFTTVFPLPFYFTMFSQFHRFHGFHRFHAVLQASGTKRSTEYNCSLNGLHATGFTLQEPHVLLTHGSFAVRPTTRQPLTISCNRLRLQRSGSKRLACFDCDLLL